jgi:NADPH-dependent 2,4-dienoyl-CoA reductase/sulfur reductase-like enzyme/ferredoxin
MMRAATVFPSFDRLKDPVPPVIWTALRVATLICAAAVGGLLVVAPQIGLPVFWGLVIPSVPAIVALAPGLWRQICPMAFVNQTPRRFGFSLGRDLPPLARDNAFAIAVLAFFILVALRRPLFNTSGAATAGMGAGALVLAFVGGVFFKGRSGWCGTFCPLGPIQRDYGHAPSLVVRNGHCPTCVGCQKNCYDLNPQAAIFDDVYDEDARYAAQRRFFFAMMPGMILGYFSQIGSGASYPWYLATLLAETLASVGVFHLVTGFFGLNAARAATLFSSVALALFYWMVAPIVMENVEHLAHADDAVYGAIPYLRGVGSVISLVLLAQGWSNERRYATAAKDEAEKAAAAALAHAAQTFEVIERTSGSAMPAAPEQTLLATLQAAGVAINASCRSGLCGSDVVAVVEGAENLSPPGPDELATLARLGLVGKARLACMCQVRGPVVIDKDVAACARRDLSDDAPKEGAGPVSTERLSLATRRAKPSRLAPVKPRSRSIVVIGNGAAGATFARALRERERDRRIVMVSAEPTHFYNRMALGKIVSGKLGVDGLMMTPPSWWEENAIEARLGARVVAIDRAERSLTTLSGEVIDYDKLVLATGAQARAPTPGFLARANCFVLRTASDAAAIRRFAVEREAASVAVIGGGVQGVEAVEALRTLGLATTLVHHHGRLMNHQLDEASGGLLRRYLEREGVRVVAGSPIAAYEGARELRSLLLKNGERVEADFFVACAGAVANMDLARACGLAVGRGVMVDERMRTQDSSIYAIGDLADLGAGPSGLWPVALAQAEIAARQIAGEDARLVPRSDVMRLKSEGVDLLALGDMNRLPREAELIEAPPFADAWWRLAVHEGRAVGAVYVGAAGSSGAFARLLRADAELAGRLDDLRRGRL